MAVAAAGLILAMDLGTRTGIAYGRPGERPTSESFMLRGRTENRGDAFAALIQWLDRFLSAQTVTAIVKEAPLPLGASAALGNAEATVRLLYGLHAVVEAMASRYGVMVDSDPAPATVRKHFIGRANAGDRKSTKAEVVKRCQLLGYIDRRCFDEDRADACSIFDWACAQRGVVAGKLHMFGERAA